ncbi:methionyl-tRNA formyltransferase [Candidatus Gracilibacteria bacterium]|nr:methionyl-tRNA formyltransferase [Candidatus Gracilibacteria bacterium]
MKIAFFGTGEFSKNILEGVLNDSRVEVALVVSQPDKVVGRKKVMQKTPIKIIAEEKSIEVLQPEKLTKNSEFLDYLDSLELDFILVVAYGKIVPMRVLNAAKFGCINLHGSRLPLYRGASPIQEAVKNGDKKTALTVMFMSKGMDEGDILKIHDVDIDTEDTTSDIFEKFEEFGSKLAIDTLEKVQAGDLEGTQQNEDDASYCSKINKQDGEIDFSKENIDNIYNKFRAYSNWPGIYCLFNDVKLNIEDCMIFTDELEDFGISNDDLQVGKVLKINKKNIGIVGADKKILILKQVKLAGKRSMDILSFINGNRDFLDYKF